MSFASTSERLCVVLNREHPAVDDSALPASLDSQRPRVELRLDMALRVLVHQEHREALSNFMSQCEPMVQVVRQFMTMQDSLRPVLGEDVIRKINFIVVGFINTDPETFLAATVPGHFNPYTLFDGYQRALSPNPRSRAPELRDYAEKRRVFLADFYASFAKEMRSLPPVTPPHRPAVPPGEAQR
jgi:hypothetical protein